MVHITPGSMQPQVTLMNGAIVFLFCMGGGGSGIVDIIFRGVRQCLTVVDKKERGWEIA